MFNHESEPHETGGSCHHDEGTSSILVGQGFAVAQQCGFHGSWGADFGPCIPAPDTQACWSSQISYNSVKCAEEAAERSSPRDPRCLAVLMMRITASQIQFFVYAATTTLVSASKTFFLKLFVGGGLKKIALDLEDVKLLQGCQNKHECKNYLRTEKSVAHWNNKKTVLSSNTTAAQHGVTHSWGTHQRARFGRG